MRYYPFSCARRSLTDNLLSISLNWWNLSLCCCQDISDNSGQSLLKMSHMYSIDGVYIYMCCNVNRSFIYGAVVLRWESCVISFFYVSIMISRKHVLGSTKGDAREHKSTRVLSWESIYLYSTECLQECYWKSATLPHKHARDFSPGTSFKELNSLLFIQKSKLVQKTLALLTWYF